MQMALRHKSKAKLVVIESFFSPINLMRYLKSFPFHDTPRDRHATRTDNFFNWVPLGMARFYGLIFTAGGA